MNLEIDASEQPRSDTLERVWIDGTRTRPGTTIDLKVLLRTYRGEEIPSRCRCRFRPTRAAASRSWSPMQTRPSQWEARELQVQPLQTRGVPKLIRLLNDARKNNAIYVRMVTRDGGAVVRRVARAHCPSGPGGHGIRSEWRQLRPLQSALLGEWEIVSGHAVVGSRTLTLPLEE